MFDRFCRNSPCFFEQERVSEIEVPTLAQLQSSINLLPTFESHYPRTSQVPPPHQSRVFAEPYVKETRNPIKRVKSEPEFELMISRHPQKENHQLHASGKYNFSHKHPHQEGLTAPSNQFMNDSVHYSRHSAHLSHQRSALMSIDAKTALPTPPSQKDLVNPAKHRHSFDNQSTTSVVSIEEYNRVMNMNRSLIKIIEEDYGSLRVACKSLEKEQRQRLRTIELLQEKVRQLKQQIGGAGQLGPRRLY